MKCHSVVNLKLDSFRTSIFNKRLVHNKKKQRKSKHVYVSVEKELKLPKID